MLEFLSRRGRFVVALTLLAALAVALLFLHDILFPFLVALFLAYVLAPVIDRMHTWKVRGHLVPRGLAVILVYLGILVILIGGGTYVVPKVSAELAKMVGQIPQTVSKLTHVWVPKAEASFENLFSLLPKPPEPVAFPVPEVVSEENTPVLPISGVPREWMDLLNAYTFEIRTLDGERVEVIPRIRVNGSSTVTQSPSPASLQEQIDAAVAQATQRIQQDIAKLVVWGQQLVGGVLGSVFTFFLIFMVAGFILVDTSRILHFFRTLIPEVHQGRYRNLVARLDTGLNGVVRGQLLICLVNGIFTLVGLVIIGVPFAFTLALVAMVCSLIPIFGTIISSIPVVIMGVTVSFGTGLLALGWILLIHFIEANFLNPKIMGTAAQIHPALIVFALVTGEYMAGIAGALLAVPIFSILQTLFLSLKALAEELEPKRFQDVPREVAGD